MNFLFDWQHEIYELFSNNKCTCWCKRRNQIEFAPTTWNSTNSHHFYNENHSVFIDQIVFKRAMRIFLADVSFIKYSNFTNAAADWLNCRLVFAFNSMPFQISEGNIWDGSRPCSSVASRVVTEADEVRERRWGFRGVPGRSHELTAHLCPRQVSIFVYQPSDVVWWFVSVGIWRPGLCWDLTCAVALSCQRGVVLRGADGQCACHEWPLLLPFNEVKRWLHLVFIEFSCVKETIAFSNIICSAVERSSIAIITLLICSWKKLLSAHWVDSSAVRPSAQTRCIQLTADIDQ